MAFFNRNKEKLPALTEPSRSDYFRKSDQNEWTRLYQLLTDEIVKMLGANKTLFEIYEYARLARGKIAKQLNHPDKEDFGVIRDFRGKDLYDNTTFANTPNYSDELFDDVVAAISKESFINKEWGDRSTIEYDYVRQPPKKTVYQLRTNQKKDFPDEMYLDIVVEKYYDEDETIIEVKVVWREMNEEIYKNRVDSVDKELLSRIKNSEKGSKEALYYIALLGHALSRDIYVRRGGAAINGAILRAVARTKGFDFGLLTMRGLPFDVCAEMMSNPHLYATEFVHEIGKAYKLFIDPELESKLELIRTQIQEIITQFKKNELPGQPSNWFSKFFNSSPDYTKEVDALSSGVNRSQHGYVPSLDRHLLLVQLLKPYVEEKPALAGDKLQKALLPIYLELKGEVQLVPGKPPTF